MVVRLKSTSFEKKNSLQLHAVRNFFFYKNVYFSLWVKVQIQCGFHKLQFFFPSFRGTFVPVGPSVTKSPAIAFSTKVDSNISPTVAPRGKTWCCMYSEKFLILISILAQVTSQLLSLFLVQPKKKTTYKNHEPLSAAPSKPYHWKRFVFWRGILPRE